MGFGDILILTGLVVLLVLAARYAYRHRHESCGGECGRCPYHQNCRKKSRK